MLESLYRVAYLSIVIRFLRKSLRKVSPCAPLPGESRYLAILGPYDCDDLGGPVGIIAASTKTFDEAMKVAREINRKTGTVSVYIVAPDQSLVHLVTSFHGTMKEDMDYFSAIWEGMSIWSVFSGVAERLIGAAYLIKIRTVAKRYGQTPRSTDC